MPDPTFFKKSKNFTLAELAVLAEGEVADDQDAQYVIENVAALDQAGSQDVSFFDNVKYKDQFLNTKAGACIVHPDMKSLAPKGVKLFLSSHPYKSYAKVADAFYPDVLPGPSISEHSIIASGAKIGKDCVIEDGVVIKDGAMIGDYCWIEANAVVGENVVLGNRVRIGVGAVLSHCKVGDYSRIYTGGRIGQDGFGFAIDPKGHVKVPQLGRVLIEEHVEIGANTTIDRGAGPDTVIGQGTWIDNLVQIGHNVKIGKGCIIVSQSGISGSTVLGDFVAVGGQVGIAGHLNIGTGAQIAAKSGIMRDIPAGEEQMGYPALPLKQYMKQVALLKRLVKKGKDRI